VTWRKARDSYSRLAGLPSVTARPRPGSPSSAVRRSARSSSSRPRPAHSAAGWRNRSQTQGPPNGGDAGPVGDDRGRHHPAVAGDGEPARREQRAEHAACDLVVELPLDVHRWRAAEVVGMARRERGAPGAHQVGRRPVEGGDVHARGGARRLPGRWRLGAQVPGVQVGVPAGRRPGGQQREPQRLLARHQRPGEVGEHGRHRLLGRDPVGELAQVGPAAVVVGLVLEACQQPAARVDEQAARWARGGVLGDRHPQEPSAGRPGRPRRYRATGPGQSASRAPSQPARVSGKVRTTW